MSRKSSTSHGTQPLIEGYFDRIDFVLKEFLSLSDNNNSMKEATSLLTNSKGTGSTIFLIGNGGSAAIAEHIAIDLTKNAGLCAMAISGTPLLTTFSNDYGYDKVFQKAIDSFAKKNDILIAISSSGTSPNILNACTVARNKGLRIITLSGFEADNPLRKMGDINFWINSRAFGHVEILHTLILHYINDSIIGSETYMVC